jgi:hypothetical protein
MLGWKHAFNYTLLYGWYFLVSYISFATKFALKMRSQTLVHPLYRIRWPNPKRPMELSHYQPAYKPFFGHSKIIHKAYV